MCLVKVRFMAFRKLNAFKVEPFSPFTSYKLTPGVPRFSFLVAPCGE